MIPQTILSLVALAGTTLAQTLTPPPHPTATSSPAQSSEDALYSLCTSQLNAYHRLRPSPARAVEAMFDNDPELQNPRNNYWDYDRIDSQCKRIWNARDTMGATAAPSLASQFSAFTSSWNSWVANIKEEALEWATRCNEFGDSPSEIDGEFNKRWGANFYALIVTDEAGCKTAISDWLGVAARTRTTDPTASETTLATTTTTMTGGEAEETATGEGSPQTGDQVSTTTSTAGVAQMTGLGGVMMGVVVVGGAVAGGLL
ncbi:hypothetical protein QBC41DRAFT_275533 [Cercophora samala]|uniref:SCP domain-containing protein n=1 Tax=Cercophora samala TaxID=330535 RepID=A0AA39ZDR7_9PEZI|nr:hypothetical protein QBC41DRAFT_275533 [Cercophora samala]